MAWLSALSTFLIHGPLEPAWKMLIEGMPDRFLMGIDVWAPRLFEPAVLDRLMRWVRRVLGQLAPDVATRVAANKRGDGLPNQGQPPLMSSVASRRSRGRRSQSTTALDAVTPWWDVR